MNAIPSLRALKSQRCGTGTDKGERANAAVEMAVLLPFIVAITFGAVDFARLFYAYIAVTNAAHQAATYAARPNGAGTGVGEGIDLS